MTDRTVRERGFLLPLGTYDDGTTGLAWPEIIHGPASAVNALMRNPTPYLDQSPEERQQTIGQSFEAAGAAALGSIGATRPPNALMQGAARVKRRPSLYDDLADAVENRPWDVQDILNRLAQQKAPPSPHQAYRGSTLAPGEIGLDRSGPRTVWASDNPNVAATYADAGASDAANVMPLRFDFQNPLMVEAGGREWDDLIWRGQPRTSTDVVARDARTAGHDGVVFRDVVDSRHGHTGRPQTTYAALQPGTTYNAFTNDLFYSNGKPASIPGVVVSERKKYISDINNQIHDAKHAARPDIPEDRLVQISQSGNDWVARIPNGEIMATFKPDRNAVVVQQSWVDGPSNGRGGEMYRQLADEALARGYGFSSDKSVSRDAQNVWNSLMRRGYRVERNPGAVEYREPPGIIPTKDNTGKLIAPNSLQSVYDIPPSLWHYRPSHNPPPLDDYLLRNPGQGE